MHSKIYPLHGTSGPWKEIKSSIDIFYENYQGYISSHDAKRVSDEQLAKIANKIVAAN